MQRRRLNRSQFGASFGGPIRRDKTFFFASVEYLHLRQSDTRFATVPSQVQKAAALAAVPADQRNPAGVNIFNLYPAANVGDPETSNSFLSSPDDQAADAVNGRHDQSGAWAQR